MSAVEELNQERRITFCLYEFWESLAGESGLPALKNMGRDEIAPFKKNLVLIDLRNGHAQPTFQVIGQSLQEDLENDLTGLPISEVPRRTMLSRVTDHYLEVLANRVPIAFEAEFINSVGENALYRGILLPFSDDNKNINFILGGVRWILEKDVTLDSSKPTIEELMRNISDGKDDSPIELHREQEAIDPVDTNIVEPETSDIASDIDEIMGQGDFEIDREIELILVNDENIDDLHLEVAPEVETGLIRKEFIPSEDTPVTNAIDTALETSDEDEILVEPEELAQAGDTAEDTLAEAPVEDAIDAALEMSDEGEILVEPEELTQTGDTAEDTLAEAPVEDAIDAALEMSDEGEILVEPETLVQETSEADKTNNAADDADLSIEEFMQSIITERNVDLPNKPEEKQQDNTAELDIELNIENDAIQNISEDILNPETPLTEQASSNEIDDVVETSIPEIPKIPQEKPRRTSVIERAVEKMQDNLGVYKPIIKENIEPEVIQINTDETYIDEDAADPIEELVEDIIADAPLEILEEVAKEPSSSDETASEDTATTLIKLKTNLKQIIGYIKKEDANHNRSRDSLYNILTAIYEFHDTCEKSPEAFGTIVAEYGLKIQSRAPFTPVLKICLGKDYDKTRLTEYAAALGIARYMNVEINEFHAFIKNFPGGIKGCVKEMRIIRKHGASGNITTRKTRSVEEAREILREMAPIASFRLKKIIVGNNVDDFCLLLAKRNGHEISVLKILDDKYSKIDPILKRAAFIKGNLNDRK